MGNCRLHVIYIEGDLKKRTMLMTSRSFSYSWDGTFCTIFRRNTPIKKVRASPGCKVIIAPSSTSPTKITVVEPAIYKLLRKVWSYGFFNALKLTSFKELLRAVDKCRIDGVISAKIVRGDNAAFAYRTNYKTNKNIPFRWWIDEDKVSVEEVAGLLKYGINSPPVNMLNPPETAEDSIIITGVRRILSAEEQNHLLGRSG